MSTEGRLRGLLGACETYRGSHMQKRAPMKAVGAFPYSYRGTA